MLPYANQMFLDILHEDGLVVTAKGLGLDDVFFSLLKVYSDPGNLVLVVGVNEEEEQYFMERLLLESDIKARKHSRFFFSGWGFKLKCTDQKLTLNVSLIF